MLANTPYLRYDRHHHPMWLLRRLRPSSRDAVLFVSVSVILAAIITNAIEQNSNLGGVTLSAASLIILPGARMIYLLIDWRTRKIRLYSDGRLDYEYGILYREGQSISMRFGFVHYRYPDRFRIWLDCADLVLPFDAGTITDIADFREFWDIAQGRV